MGSVGGALAPGVGARRCSGYSPNLRLLVSSGPGLHCQGSAHRPAGVWRKRGKVTVCTPFTLQVIGQTTCCFWSEVWYVPTFALWLDTLTKSFVVMHLTHPGKSKPARRCSSMFVSVQYAHMSNCPSPSRRAFPGRHGNITLRCPVRIGNTNGPCNSQGHQQYPSIPPLLALQKHSGED